MGQSMLRVGKCIDKGTMESFWDLLKPRYTFYSSKYLIASIEQYRFLYNDEKSQ